jgi:nicotinate-nucleotide adenylyltransferase
MVGLMGGTFNPIHNGHLHLALMLREIHALEEVWFIPSLQNPLKEEMPIPFEHRYKMVERAISTVPGFKALSIESERAAPSYTIDTVKELQKRFPTTKFHLLLGDDTILSLHAWKNIKELLEMCPPLVGTRQPVPCMDPRIKELIEKGITPIPILDISSTFLRERLKNNLYSNHLIPAPVLDYIKQNGLYYLPYE